MAYMVAKLSCRLHSPWVLTHHSMTHVLPHVLDDSDDESLHPCDDAELPRAHSGRQDSIAVDGRAHADESGRSAEQAEDEAVPDSMGLSEEAGTPAVADESPDESDPFLEDVADPVTFQKGDRVTHSSRKSDSRVGTIVAKHCKGVWLVTFAGETARVSGKLLQHVCSLEVTCVDSDLTADIKGTYEAFSFNHGKVVYRKDEKSKGIPVYIYYWDARDGEDLCGWWFAPQVGGDEVEVWAYHPGSAHTTPPASDWKIPFNGAVDPLFTVTPKSKEAAPEKGEKRELAKELKDEAAAASERESKRDRRGSDAATAKAEKESTACDTRTPSSSPTPTASVNFDSPRTSHASGELAKPEVPTVVFSGAPLPKRRARAKAVEDRLLSQLISKQDHIAALTENDVNRVEGALPETEPESTNGAPVLLATLQPDESQKNERLKFTSEDALPSKQEVDTIGFSSEESEEPRSRPSASSRTKRSGSTGSMEDEEDVAYNNYLRMFEVHQKKAINPFEAVKRKRQADALEALDLATKRVKAAFAEP